MSPERQTALSIAIALGTVAGALGIGASVMETQIVPALRAVALEPDGSALCVIPDSVDDVEVDCFGFGPLGLPDGGPRWLGVNTMPVRWAIGDDCIETPCEIAAGRRLARIPDAGNGRRAKMDEVDFESIGPSDAGVDGGLP